MRAELDLLCKNMLEGLDRSRTYKQVLEYLSVNTNEAMDFWRYDGISVLFLQEITNFYECLEKTSFTSDECIIICHLINILQSIAAQDSIRTELVQIQLPFFLYPFLNTSNTSQKSEHLRIASLGFINVFIQSDEQEVISFFRKTEIIPLTLKCMDIGTPVSKILASNIFLFILRNRDGLNYAVQTAERFVAISVMLNLVLGHCVHISSNEIIRNILECYVILSTEENARLSFRSSFPKNLVNGKIMERIDNDAFLKDLFLKFHKNVKPGSVFKLQ